MTRRAPVQTQLPLDLRAPFERLVEDAAGDFRPTPLARLMAAHLPLFMDLHRRGASWAQTAGLLAAHGITGPDSPFTAAVVRATYSRVCAAASAHAAHRNKAQQVETQRNPSKRDGSDRRLDATGVNGARPAGPQHTATDRNVTHRHAADGSETESALHNRAALLNRQNGRR